MDSAPAWPAALDTDGDVLELPQKKRPRTVRQAQVESDFVVQNKSFTKQFAAIYYARLQLLRPEIVKKAQQELVQGEVTIFEKIVGLEVGKECVLIGTIYKEMKLKPCILDEYVVQKIEDGERIVPDLDCFVSEDDSLILEDEFGRIALTTTDPTVLNVMQMISGVVMAVRGEEATDGSFLVNAVCCAGVPVPPPLPPADKDVGPSYIALLSGLSFGEPSHSQLPSQLLLEYLTGFLGGAKDQNLVSSISRVIIAGDSLHRFETHHTDYAYNKKIKSQVVAPLKDLDMFLAQLCASLPVHVMPGACDPANFALPQQPLNSCLFPSSRMYSSLKLETNPLRLQTEGLQFLGTSGQNIEDMTKFASAPRLTHLEHTLQWRNVAPSAPDTLACYPFQDSDPFVLGDSGPHVYFAGNQPEFGTSLIKTDGRHTRVVLIPSFAKTSTLLLLNTADLSVHPITFSAL